MKKINLNIKMYLLKNKQKIYIYLSLCILGVVILSLFLRTIFKENYYLGLNFTPSLHEKIFIIDKKSDLSTIKRDDIIGFKYPDEDYSIFKKGDYFIKYVICMEGDHLIVDSQQIRCNDKFYGSALKKDSEGTVLKQFAFNGIVPKGKYFMWTPFIKSFDSRYWGFIEEKDIVGKAVWRF